MALTDTVTMVETWFAQPFGLYGAEPDDDDGGSGGDSGSDGTGGEGNSGGQGDNGGNADDGLTDKGRQAIDRERQSAQRARDKYKPWGQIGREFNLTPEQVRERLAGGSGSDGGNSGGSGQQGDSVSKADVEAARREAAAEASAKANRRILRAEVKALAADTFADPSDAALYIDLDEFEVDEDGDVDVEAIRKTLKDVLKAKPHLAKRKSSQTSGGSPDGGARDTPPKPKGMSDFIRSARR